MGCTPSRQGGVSRYERKRVESILSKSVEKTTKSDIAALNAFLRQYENENEMKKPLMLLADVQSRLAELNGLELSSNGIPMGGNVNSVPITDYDKTVGKIKSEIYKLKTKIKRLYGEKDNLMEMAKDNRSNEALAVSYVRMAKKKEEQLKTTYGLLSKLEDNLNTLDSSKVTEEMVHLMSNVASTLESVRAQMGSRDDIEKLMDRLDVLKENVQEVNGLLFSEEEEPDPSYLDEIDESIAKDEAKANQLPSVPTSVPKTKAVTEQKSEPVMELA